MRISSLARIRVLMMDKDFSRIPIRAGLSLFIKYANCPETVCCSVTPGNPYTIVNSPDFLCPASIVKEYSGTYGTLV